VDQVPPIPRDSPFYRFFNGSRQRQELITGEGSRFFISADGYIVTNNHVVANTKTTKVTPSNGDIYAAKVLGTDPSTAQLNGIVSWRCRLIRPKAEAERAPSFCPQLRPPRWR